MKDDREAFGGGRQSMSKLLNDLFHLYAIPPSPLHEAVQEAARQEGWTPPWDHEEQHRQQQTQKKTAGRRSAIMRAGRAQIRVSLIELARGRLDPEHRYAPYSKPALDSLREEYCKLLTDGDNDPNVIIPLMLSALSETDRKFLKNISRETLKKDVKAIRKKHGVRR
jgi:hypothetical protein